MKQFFRKSLLGMMTVGIAASMVGCADNDLELYQVGEPDWLQEKIDQIAADKANSASNSDDILNDLMEDVYSFGATDFSSGWWAEFSKYYIIPDGEKWTAVFKLNINPDAANTFKNFALILTNDDDRGGSSYKEYGAIRFDHQPSGNSEWGDDIDRSAVESNLTFETDSDKGVDKLGGQVTLTIDRSVPGEFTVVMTNGEVTKSYKQKTPLANRNADETNTNIRAFICVEGSYIDFLGTSIEPIGGATSRNDKQPIKITLANTPKAIELSDNLDIAEIAKDVTAVVEFEEGVKKDITAKDLIFTVIPDLTTIGKKTIAVGYSTTFKGEATAKPVIAVFDFEVTAAIDKIEAEAAIETYVYAKGTTEIKAEDIDASSFVKAVKGKTGSADIDIPVSECKIEVKSASTTSITILVTYKDFNTDFTVKCQEMKSENVSLAGTTVEAGGFVANFSPFTKVEVGTGKTFTFTNIGSQAANHEHFIINIRKSEDSDIWGADSYAVMRADNALWGPDASGKKDWSWTITPAIVTECDWVWDGDDTHKTMKEAANGKVTVEVINKGNFADVLCTIESEDGNTYHQNYKNIPVNGEFVVGFTNENAKLIFE